MRQEKYTKKNFTIDGFVSSCTAYLKQGEILPVLSVDSAAMFPKDRISIEVALAPGLMTKVRETPEKYARDLQAIVTYGYMGSSRGGVNGVVVIPKRDKNLKGAVNRFRHPRYEAFAEAFGVDPTSEELVEVKVVTHRKNGERLVGVFQRSKRKVILYDTRSYRK